MAICLGSRISSSLMSCRRIVSEPMRMLLRSTNNNIHISTATCQQQIENNTTSQQSTKDYQPEVPVHIKSIVDSISQLKFYEISLLNETLRKTLNIPDAPMVMAGGLAQDANKDDDEAVQSAGVKTQFTVKLTKFEDTKKVALIKEIKKLVEGINLVEAKRFVEECPKVIRSNITKDEAEALKKQLEDAGGVVTIE